MTRLGLLGPLVLAACGGKEGDSARLGETDISSTTGPGQTNGTAAGPGTGAATGSTGTGTGTGATTTDSGTAGPRALVDRIRVTDVASPEGVKEGVTSWRIWGLGSLKVAPVFTEPLASCQTLVGFTTRGAGLTARVVLLDTDDQLSAAFELGPGLELRGLATEPTGHFGALLWDPVAERIWVRRYDLSGAELWSRELVNGSNHPDDFGIGDSRLAWGDGRYGAYYHVHSNDGHEGDTLKWVDGATGAESMGWTWGCSHSMSNVLRYHRGLDAFLPACVTDCYPGTSGNFATESIGGIYLEHTRGHVMDIDAGCNGSVAGELGSAALSSRGWALVFNAHVNPATGGQSSYDPSTMNQDIGLALIAEDLSSTGPIWLTSTPGDEDDASIARWSPSDDPTEQFLVGWHTPDDSWALARIDATGAFLEGPIDVGRHLSWGRRDDPFRRHVDSDVVWAWFDDAGAATLHVARVDSGQPEDCATL